jgi:excisionase family DNA binding protein
MKRHYRVPLDDLMTFPYKDVSPVELADYLRCDARTIIRMIQTGALFAYRVGRKFRIPIEEARRAFPPTREFHVKTQHETERASNNISGTSLHTPTDF